MKSLLRPFEPWVSGLHCNSGGKMLAASNVAKSRDLKNCHNNQVVGGSGDRSIVRLLISWEVAWTWF